MVALASIVAGCRPADRVVRADDDLAPTDASLVRYREIGQLDIAAPDPTGIAVAPDGALWVAGAGVVARLADSPGPSRSGRADLPAQATVGGAAQCVAAAQGALFVGVGDHVEVVRAGADRLDVWAPLSDSAVITCIAIGKESVYVADAGARRIARCDPTGRVLGYLCEKDPARNYKGLIVPSPHLD
ncbi:MAG: hypothetical protein FJX72_10300, partial [Armatimonadetes bacterium]|nr:hypothetical protein [Armatimonadota bacterium]